MRIVILGGRGQLAGELFTMLHQDVVLASRHDLDLTSNMMTGLLHGYRPDLVINCAAWNKVDLAEVEPNEAMHVNAWGPKALAQYCHDHHIRLIHFSTDHVFGGDKRIEPYKTVDPPCPVNTYGISKLAGEIAVRSHCEDHLIIRTCGLYGNLGRHGKPNFPEMILQKAQAHPDEPLEVVCDLCCTPTYTQDLAIQVVRMLYAPSGTYHITNAGACSWYEFARELLYTAGIKAKLIPILAAEYKRKHSDSAKRPLYSVLDNERARLQKLGINEMPRHWTRAIAPYLEERANVAPKTSQSEKGES
jgi:dTDP-4-dehydrorhamnose reductase